VDKFEEVEKMLDDDKVFVNDQYQVNVKYVDTNKEAKMKGMLWLSIKRKDKHWIRDWRELQKIKNEIAGPEREGCEIYPAESRLVDTSNQFHIFVLPDGDKFPFGYSGRLVVEGHKGGWDKGSSQRPFKKGQEPNDIKTLDEVKEMEKKLRGEMENEHTIRC